MHAVIIVGVLVGIVAPGPFAGWLISRGRKRSALQAVRPEPRATWPPEPPLAEWGPVGLADGFPGCGPDGKLPKGYLNEEEKADDEASRRTGRAFDVAQAAWGAQLDATIGRALRDLNDDRRWPGNTYPLT